MTIPPSGITALPSRGRCLLAPCLLAAIMLACGCVSIYVQETFEKASEPGTYISELDLARVKRGVTTRDDLVALLGSPSDATQLGPDHEVLTYTYWVRRSEQRTVAPIKQSVRVTHSVLSLKCDVQRGVVTGVERELVAPNEAEADAE
jgi:outer membrane protein assembly factor BamE (lipoprotein component of BamABCDE complex)